MLKIAICIAADKNGAQRAQALEQGILLWSRRADGDVRTKFFGDGSRLLAYMEKKGKFDLFFLDLSDQDSEGLQIASKIRQTDLNPGIVFLSNGGKHEREAYRVHPFQFLSEPPEYQCLAEIMDDYIRLKGQDEENFVCVIRKTRCCLRLKDIRYFYSECRHVTAVCDGQSYSFYGRLNEVQSRVDEKSGCFLRIHQSYLINVRYIKEYSYDKVLMANGELLGISRDRRKKVREIHALMEG